MDITSTSAFAPEPGVLSLMAAGLAALCCLKHFRRNLPRGKAMAGPMVLGSQNSSKVNKLDLLCFIPTVRPLASEL